jgi:hypothetical protein
MARPKSIIPVERIAARIYLIRGDKVMLDSDLAELYGVQTKALNQAVTRNRDRFPEDFMFRLSAEEFETLRSQIVTSSWGGRRYPPFAFTEHGVAMLSSVLRSKKATQVNIDIIRAFIMLRHMLAGNAALARKIEQLDRKVAVLYEAFQKLLQPDAPKKRRIGYITPLDEPDDG